MAADHIRREGETWCIQPESPSILGQIAVVSRHSNLFWQFATRALFEMYEGTIIGIGWIAIRALAITIPATFIVGEIFNVSVAPVPLALFILVGLANWTLFRRSLMMMVKSMRAARSLLRCVYVPALLLLATSASPGIFEFLVVMVVVVALATYFGPIEGVFYISLDWNMVALVPACLLTLLLALGIGCFLSILNAFTRDTQLTLRYTLSFFLLATPILYPIDVIPEPYRWIVYLNPMAPVVELFRWALLGYGTVNWAFLGLAVMEILVLLLLGIWFFAKMQNRLFDHM